MLPESLTLGHRNLEDVFLELTGRQLADRTLTTPHLHPEPGAARLPRRCSPRRDGVPADAAQRRAAAAGRGHPRDRPGRAGRRRRSSRTSTTTARRRLVTPGVLALAVMSTAFTSLAIATGFERRYGVLKRLGSSPLPRSGLLAGKVLGAARGRGRCRSSCSRRSRSRSAGPPCAASSAAVLAVLLGTAAFASLGLLHRRDAARRGDAGRVANLVYLLLLAGGAVVLRPRRTAGSATSRPGCRPGRSARRCARPSRTARLARPRVRAGPMGGRHAS